MGTPPANPVDSVGEASLPALLAPRLVGTPAGGAVSAASTLAPRMMTATGTFSAAAAAALKVIWVEGGDEALVHLDSVRARVLRC